MIYYHFLKVRPEEPFNSYKIFLDFFRPWLHANWILFDANKRAKEDFEGSIT